MIITYTYKLYDYCIVEENTNTWWYLYQLRKSEKSISKLDRPSFVRTKKWLFENYPELLI
jgi:hypothetical protein